MSLNDWITYVTPKGSISHCIGTVQAVDGSPSKHFLNIEGEKKGHFYLLPNGEHIPVRGQLSGCFRTIYRHEIFPATSEVRIYCMMSKENLQRGAQCYAAALNGDRRVLLYKYTRGLVSTPEVLCSLRLPGTYRQGVFGLMWTYNPQVTEGVFFRCFLSVNPEKPEETFRLFDFVDRATPLTESVGEGFGLSLLEPASTRVIFRKTALHALTFHTDPQEMEGEPEQI